MLHNVCRCDPGLSRGKRPRAARKRWLEGAAVVCLGARKGFPESFAKRALRLVSHYDLTIPPLLEELRGASADAR
jgi:hypothetical protein